MDAILYRAVSHLLCRVDKGLLDVVRRLGRGFQKDKSVLPRKRLALGVGHCTAVLQVALVPDLHGLSLGFRALHGGAPGRSCSRSAWFELRV